MNATSALDRAQIALEGLSVGDALGGFFEFAHSKIPARVQLRQVSQGPWHWTDDTQMAASAEITHAHPEAQAGAIAVAIAAALAWQMRQTTLPSSAEFLQLIQPWVPASQVAEGLAAAIQLDSATPIATVAARLGNGSKISAQDTVPFALWCAAQHLADFEQAIWLTLEGMGDCDTTCAIVGGIVASYTGVEGIPAAWREAREALPAWAFSEELS